MDNRPLDDDAPPSMDADVPAADNDPTQPNDDEEHDSEGCGDENTDTFDAEEEYVPVTHSQTLFAHYLCSRPTRRDCLHDSGTIGRLVCMTKGLVRGIR
jgi:hypothetical protein